MLGQRQPFSLYLNIFFHNWVHFTEWSFVVCEGICVGQEGSAETSYIKPDIPELSSFQSSFLSSGSKYSNDTCLINESNTVAELTLLLPLCQKPALWEPPQQELGE